MIENTKYSPSFTAAKLYRKTSAKGATYFVGRMGGAKVALIKSKETAENGDEIWSLMFSEATPYVKKDDADANASSGQPSQSRSQQSASDNRAKREWQKPSNVADTERPSLDYPIAF